MERPLYLDLLPRDIIRRLLEFQSTITTFDMDEDRYGNATRREKRKQVQMLRNEQVVARMLQWVDPTEYRYYRELKLYFDLLPRETKDLVTMYATNGLENKAQEELAERDRVEYEEAKLMWVHTSRKRLHEATADRNLYFQTLSVINHVFKNT